jgi:hypothetical protein
MWNSVETHLTQQVSANPQISENTFIVVFSHCVWDNLLHSIILAIVKKDDTESKEK